MSEALHTHTTWHAT